MVLKRAHDHKGASFVEIFQNCIVYNDGVFNDFTEKKTGPDTQLHVEHGKPLIFGTEGNKGICVNHDILDLEVVTVGENGVTMDDVLVHDETNRTLAGWLARMQAPEFPVAIGVLYCDPAESYEAAVGRQIEDAKKKTPQASLNSLLQSGHTWTVEPH